MNFFKNKIILITGDKSSFGSALIFKIFKSKINFKEIRVFIGEEKKQDYSRKKINYFKFKFMGFGISNFLKKINYSAVINNIFFRFKNNLFFKIFIKKKFSKILLEVFEKLFKEKEKRFIIFSNL